MQIIEFYVTDARESPGSIYRVQRGIRSRFHRRSTRNIYSVAFSRAGTPYFVNANENHIYRITAAGGEEIVYTHTTYVRDIVIDARDAIYFSEASGAGADGKIYRLSPASHTASLYQTVRLADVGGFWAGNFTFDTENNLYISSGNRVPSSIYELTGGRWHEVYTEREPIMGLTFLSCDLLCYANWRSAIYMLDLQSGTRELVYSNPAFTWLSDVAFINPRVEEETLYEGTKTYTCDWAFWREDGTVESDDDYYFPDITEENDTIASLITSIGCPTALTTDDTEIWERVRAVWSWMREHVLGEGDPGHEDACSYRDSVEGWPSINDYAEMFSRFGGFCWGSDCSCMCRAEALATLLCRVGIPPDRMAIAESRWAPEYSQHMFIVLRLGCHWYYLDPTSIPGSELSDSPANVGSTGADYTHPNSLTLVPGSRLTRPMLVR